MSESSESPQEKVAKPEMEQQQDLDEVFSTFFQKVEELKPVAEPRSAKEYLQSNGSISLLQKHQAVS